MNNESNQQLSIKIINVDYYLTKPTSDLKDPCYSGFRSLPIYNVPVIRIFGPNSEGVKTCAHIHGVFPYIFIPNWNNEITDKDLYQFAFHLDKAINTSFANSSSKTSHIYRISKVSGRPFYGYSENEKQFMKIEFYNPAIIKRVTDLLQSGVIFGISFQPYEAHVPYILQFFIDNNLYGMSHIVLSSYYIRQDDINFLDRSEDNEIINSGFCNIPKQSYCALEVDTSVFDINNPYTNSDNMPNNPGLAFIWEEERKRRRLQNRISQITPSKSQNRPEKALTRTELYFKTKLNEKLRGLMTDTCTSTFLNSFDTKNVSLLNSSHESELNSSYEELNTQSRSILSLLKQLVNPSDEDKNNTSACSSSFIIHSNDKLEDKMVLTPLSSQPVLKLLAEDDSILGEYFSDNDVDDADHFDLSRVLSPTKLELSTSTDNSDSENLCDIPQIDGANGDSFKKKKVKTKKDCPKSYTRTNKRYNLRSKNKESNSTFETDDIKKNRTENKVSPKKFYPQLQIDTQKSPKSSSIRSFVDQQQSIAFTGFSPISTSACIDESEKLKSPSFSICRSISNDECKKSETKRPYPQLEVNIKKSPRPVTKIENEEASLKLINIRLRKRKIDFGDSETKSNTNDLFDISSVTAKWKKQHIKKNKEIKNSKNLRSTQLPNEDSSSFNCKNNVNLNTSKDVVSNLTENISDTIAPKCTYIVENGTISQDYSLKIHVNTCEADEKTLYKNFLLKQPVIKLQHIQDINMFKFESNNLQDNLKSEEKECGILTSRSENSCRIKDMENSSLVKNTNDLFQVSNEKNINIGKMNKNHRWSEIRLTPNANNILENKNDKCTGFRFSKNHKNELEYSQKESVNNVNENKIRISFSEENYQNKKYQNSLKRKQLGMRMTIKNNNACTGNGILNTKNDDIFSQNDTKMSLNKKSEKIPNIEECIPLINTNNSSSINSSNTYCDDSVEAKTIILSKNYEHTTDNIFSELNLSITKTKLKDELSVFLEKEKFEWPEKEVNMKNKKRNNNILVGKSLNAEFNSNNYVGTENTVTVINFHDRNNENNLISEKANSSHEDKININMHSAELELFSDTEKISHQSKKDAKLNDLELVHTVTYSADYENNDIKFDVNVSGCDINYIESKVLVYDADENSQEKELFTQTTNNYQEKNESKSKNINCIFDCDKNKSINDVVTVTCSLNSDEDVLFSELDLNVPVIQSAVVSNTDKSLILNDNYNNYDLIHKESTSNSKISENIMSKTSVEFKNVNNKKLPQSILEKTSTNVTTCKYDFDFNNSLWDSVEDENFDDNGIKSFYVESPKSVDITLFKSRETIEQNLSSVQKLSSESDNEILDDDSHKSSSPIAQTLTPLCENHEISNSSTKNEELTANSIVKNSISLNDDSPTLCGFTETILHSTPQQEKKLRTSPSPTYTPILKKLILKQFNGSNKNRKRRISSQRFQSEPFLCNIKEEDETKCDIKDISVSLPLNVSIEKSSEEIKTHNSSRSSSCIGGSGQIDITLSNTHGFRMNLENLQDGKTDIQYQFITVISLEIFTETRHDLKPDPEFDPICCLFYSIFHDTPSTPKLLSGVIISDNGKLNVEMQRFTCEKLFVKNENELFDSFIKLIRKWDPDIFIGYEVEMLSWGYFIQRGQYLNRQCEIELSRIKYTKMNDSKEKTVVDGNNYSTEFKLIGRIVLNVWRLMRHEVSIQSYTFENILFHVLHQRVPQYSFMSLTQWWKNSFQSWIVIDYYLLRVESNILILQQLDFFGRTSELARLFGIQFYEVLSRGSQFRVESMMLRLAKTQNFVAVSPSIHQRAAMKAPESLPLIMEPESKFYTDPVIVLDFQSLYPSIIIAYNYCFSTCLGRIQYLGENETFELGCIQHTVPVDLLRKLELYLNFSPCGVAFVNKTIRTGILPSMLEEILETRLMVKKSMKENKNNNILQRVLHARQLGLKLIANVTYGYTAANFSGRMPCIEIGDSVVSKGRETLERAIELVSSTKKWEAKVIYGDTDSIFVMVPNRTKIQAFKIGAEIAEAVTNSNPKPIKLKLEKVYYPCILQTKKRYVGYMYENPEQIDPIYDAKGIETVRRDGCPAVCKILEKSLKLLFENKDSDIVKRYVQRQFMKLMSGRLSIQELTFAREYRGMHNYKQSACVPALHIARLALQKDRRSEPRIKERVKYVLVAGAPNLPLIKLVRTPEQFLKNPGSIINAEYYITRAVIPVLERCFSLINVDVRCWYSELPRRQKYLPIKNNIKNEKYKKKTIFHYFTSSKCVVCKELAISGVCKQCENKPQHLAIVLGNMINSWERKHNYISKICRSCCGRNNKIECTSLDCPNFYMFHQTLKDIEQVSYIEELQQKYLCFNPSNRNIIN